MLRLNTQLFCFFAAGMIVCSSEVAEANSSIKCAGRKVPFQLHGRVIGNFTPFTKCGSITYFARREISREEFINIRQEPSSRSEIVGRMRDGDVEAPRFFESTGFITLGNGSRWIKGKTVGIFADGTQGWVHESQLIPMDN